MNLALAVVVVSAALLAADAAQGKMDVIDLRSGTDQHESQDKNEAQEKKDACDCCSVLKLNGS